MIRMRSLLLLAPYLLVSAVIVLILLLVLRSTDLQFGYSLDDPYIHLALSEQLARGHYGINAFEPSAPSSSILWPFLLAPFANTKVHVYIPLLLNWACAMGLVWSFRRLLVQLRLSKGDDVLGCFGPVIACLLLNVPGLVFVGMEHTAHVMASAWIVLGMISLIDARHVKAPWWFVGALVICPWLRYEGLALTGMTCLLLLRGGRWRLALSAGAVSFAGVLAFSGTLLRWGLAALPSSVLVKTGHEPLSMTRVSQFLFAATSNGRPLATFTTAGALTMVGLFSRSSATRQLAWLGACTAMAHLVGGQYGWFERYEVYCFAILLSVGVFVLRKTIASFTQSRGQWAALGVFAATVAPLAFPYLQAIRHTPRACGDIYTQQHQMHRFVTEFHRGPVAVNDLGWVAYRNPQPVLDLWGLGSETARRARAEKPMDASWIECEVARYGVKVALLYEAWFPALPATWQRVGLIRNPDRVQTSACDTVSVLVVDALARDRVIGELEAFARTVPQGTEVTIFRSPAERSLTRRVSCHGGQLSPSSEGILQAADTTRR